MPSPATPLEGEILEARPEPVLDAGRLAGLVSAVVVAVVGLVAVVTAGVTLDDLDAVGTSLAAIGTAIAAVVAYVAPVWQARKARAKVTPLADPRDDRGEALVVDVGDGFTAPPYVLDPQTPGVADHAAPEAR